MNWKRAGVRAFCRPRADLLLVIEREISSCKNDCWSSRYRPTYFFYFSDILLEDSPAMVRLRRPLETSSARVITAIVITDCFKNTRLDIFPPLYRFPERLPFIANPQQKRGQ